MPHLTETRARMEFEYPAELPLLLKQSRAEFESDLRFLAAAKLYELGRISSGKAAQLAGVSRVAFLTRLGQYGIPAINLQGDEIQAEIIEAAGDDSE